MTIEELLHEAATQTGDATRVDVVLARDEPELMEADDIPALVDHFCLVGVVLAIRGDRAGAREAIGYAAGLSSQAEGDASPTARLALLVAAFALEGVG